MDKLTIKETKTILNIKQIGSPGPKGDDGDQGLSATINIGTVNTVNYNEPATVENVGTENEAIFNFNIPKGQPGSSGAEFENVGTGLGIWKETVDSIAKLRSILSLSDIITLSLDDLEETITVDINGRALNSAISTNLEGINQELTIIEEQINNLYDDLGNNVANIYSTIATINTSIDNINTSLNSLGQQIGTNTNSINTINNSITSINNQLTSINTSITALNSKVLPSGGTAGQVLTKTDSTDYHASWQTPSGGGSSVFNFNNFTRLKRIYPYASRQNTALNIVLDGYSNSSSNYPLSESDCIQLTAGKGYYYQYPKRAYRDTSAGASQGYCAGNIYYSSFNMLSAGEAIIKVGIRSRNDTAQAQFVGFTSGTSLPTQINNVLGSANDYFIGFGYNQTDTVIHLIYSYSFYNIKIPLTSFTGSFSSSDVQARMIETPMSYQITPYADGTGFKATFYNHKTRATGTYNFLYSTVNSTYMFNDTSIFSPVWVNFQSNGYAGTKDIFDLFFVSEMS